MVGTVVERVDTYKGKPLSANLPVKVQFQKEHDGKMVKFVVHLADDEVELA